MPSKVIIVGAGLGGLCAGIRLLHHGYQVSIYEKNDKPGGVVTSITSPDSQFTFDESASIGINPLTYLEIFNYVHKNPLDYFKWTLLDTHYKVFWKEGASLTLSAHLAETQKNIEKYFPEDVHTYTAFIYDVALKYLDSKKYLLSKPYLHQKDFYNLVTWYHLLKLNPLVTANTYASHYINSSLLQELILFQTFFMGISPYKIPAIYSAIPANSQLEGIIHIKGGLGAYSEALCKLFTDLGGVIYYNHPVDQLAIDSKKVKGILCNNKMFSADTVILNANYPYSQRYLLGRRSLRHLKFSCSTFIVHLGLDKHYTNLAMHNLFINTHFREEINRIFGGKLPLHPSLYIYSPSCIDPSFCLNPSHSVMNIMVRVPHLSSSGIRWNVSTQNQLYHLCLNTIKTLPGLSDIEHHILHHSFTTPAYFAQKYHYYKGSCFGIGHTFFQSLVFRPQIQDKQYTNLYFVGSSIHPGNGASIVMDCAKLLVDTLLKQSLS